MNQLTTKFLLFSVAKEYHRQKEAFSRVEIVKKINEIKYLSAQKKVPRLTLRKEILHLEKKLESIFELEQRLASLKHRESDRVKKLKHEVTTLHKRLAACEDKDLQKKVDRLSHLLADALAKRRTTEDVALSTKIQEEITNREEKVPQDRYHLLKEKAEKLRQRVDLEPSNSPLRIRLEMILSEINERLQEADFGDEKKEEPQSVKHTMIFNTDVSSPKKEDSDLPLPPPPKR